MELSGERRITVFVVMLVILAGTVAYNSIDYPAPSTSFQPAVMGHSADEIAVDCEGDGVIETLEDCTPLSGGGGASTTIDKTFYVLDPNVAPGQPNFNPLCNNKMPCVITFTLGAYDVCFDGGAIGSTSCGLFVNAGVWKVTAATSIQDSTLKGCRSVCVKF